MLQRFPIGMEMDGLLEKSSLCLKLNFFLSIVCHTHCVARCRTITGRLQIDCIFEIKKVFGTFG